MKRAGAALALAAAWVAAPAFATDTVYYYHTDALHSEVVITDASHNVVERTYYGPYGEVLNRPLRDGPGYGGHEEDAATGLDNLQQRYYDPITGRFPSIDPVDVDTTTGENFNRYAYAGNNPYRYTDPDGRMKDQDQERSPNCTGTHICSAGPAGALNIKVRQVGSPSVSAMKAAAAQRSTSSPATAARNATAAAGAVGTMGEIEGAGGEALNLASKVTGRALGVVGMVLSLSGDTPQKEDQSTYVIGEGMNTRVIPFATSIGADYYHGAPPGVPESQYLNHNRLWINGVMDQNAALINIGPERGREFYPNPTSQNYRMELEEIKLRNYPVMNVDVP